MKAKIKVIAPLIFVSEFTAMGVRSSMGDIKLSSQNKGPGINSLLVALSEN